MLLLAACTSNVSGSSNSEEKTAMSLSNKTFIYKAVDSNDISKLDENMTKVVESSYFVFGNGTIELWITYGYSTGEIPPYKQFSGTFAQENFDFTFSYDHWASGDDWEEMDEGTKSQYSNFTGTISDKDIIINRFTLTGDLSSTIKVTYTQRL